MLLILGRRDDARVDPPQLPELPGPVQLHLARRARSRGAWPRGRAPRAPARAGARAPGDRLTVSGAQGELEPEALVGVVERLPEQLTQPRKAVANGLRMNAQPRGHWAE